MAEENNTPTPENVPETTENAAPVEAGQFIGPRKVESVVILANKTPNGLDMLEVTYSGGHKEVMSDKMFQISFTDTPSDWSALRERRVSKISPEIVSTLQEYDLKIADIDSVLRMVGTEINNRLYRANNYLWNGKDENFVPGFDATGERTLMQIEGVLTKIQAKTDESAQTSN